MARRGQVSTDPRVIRSAVDVTLERGCASVVIDHGDLHRVDHLETSASRDLPRRRSQALLAADGLLGHVASKLDFERDLLLVVSPTSPTRDRPEHLGVAVAVGRNFASGSAMTSATTQRLALVSLTGVAPTVLEHLGLRRPASMLGRPWFAAGSTTPTRITAAVELDAESRFTEANRGRAAVAFFVWATSVLGLALLARRRSRRAASASSVGPWVAAAVLSLVAFPVTTYLMGLLPQHALGTAGFVLAFGCVNSSIVALALLVARQSLARLYLIVGTSWAVLMLDVLIGARLQLNTLWGYNPVGAGRFYGVGNVAYAVLAASALVTATLVVRGPTAPRRSLLLATGVLASTVIVDSAPMLGADVGGFLSLIPGFILAWMLLAGRRIAVRQVLSVLVALVLLAAAFLAWDLSRPPETQTHLARLYDSVRGAGLDVLWNTIARKLATNVKVLRSTVWPYTFAVAASVVAWALVPPARRRRLRSQEPQVYAGLLGGVLVALLGFLINDSGIVIPAVMMPFLASVILLLPRRQEALDPVGAAHRAHQRPHSQEAHGGRS
jgi:hypothetical protein